MSSAVSEPGSASGPVGATLSFFGSAGFAHAAPFIAWIGIMSLLEWLWGSSAWVYALRTFTCLGLLLVLRPWRWYAPLRIANLPLAAGVGVLVFAFWVGPEVVWSADVPAWQDIYLRFLVLPLARLPVADATYAPEHCGWLLALIRLAGSAFVIAIIEEFFWRGFLYRWFIDRSFLKVSLHGWDWEAVAYMGLLFGFEHQRWLVGILAGLAYLWLMLRTRDIWAAIVAHVITNFLLGLYVLAAGAYAFW